VSGGPTQEERDRSFGRVRNYYASYPEWDRLEQFPDGRLEFEVNKAWIQRYLPPPGARVLDLGCGPGRYAVWLAELGYRVTVADLSPELLTIAQEKAAEAGVSFDLATEVDARDLEPFGAASFDAVLCMGPMYHLVAEADRRAAAAEVVRVLRPGSPAFVAFLNRVPAARVLLDPRLPPIPAEMATLFDRWADTGVFIAPGKQMFTEAYYIHPDEACSLMESAGLGRRELISSETVMSGAEEKLNGPEERQPHLYSWFMDRLIETRASRWLPGHRGTCCTWE
jgi:ubiquinone/menaquinone biosynthesis C-methylase UbiE